MAPPASALHSRATALAELSILDTPPEPGFGDLTQIAATVCNAPVAYIGFVDGERQWLKSEVGIGLRETPLQMAVCKVTIDQPEILVVPDLSRDPRFADLPFVKHAPHVRFYAGVPLHAPSGEAVGTICVMDFAARSSGLTPVERNTLLALATATEAQLKLRHANAVLAHSEARYRALTLASAAMVWTSAPQGGAVTTSYDDFTGIGETDLLGTGWLRAVHPDDQLPAMSNARNGHISGQPYSHEFRLKHASGDYRWVRVKSVPVHAADGSILEWVGVNTDIHDAKLAEAALRESEAHYRHAVELNPQIPWTADAAGNITEVGPRWHDLVGMTREQALGQGWANAIHPDDVTETFARWAIGLSSGDPIDVSYRVITPSGGYRWMRARASARRDENGDIVRWYGTLEDIQQQRDAEQALRESEEFARSILDSTSNAIEVLDIDGRQRFINMPGNVLFENDTGQNTLGVFYDTYYADDVKPLLHNALAAARRGEKSRYHVASPTYKGTPKWWEVSVSPIFGATGAVERILVITADATEAKLAEAAMTAANRRLTAVLDTTMDCVVVVGTDWRISFLNKNAIDVVGQGAAIGSDLREVLHDIPMFDRLARAMAEHRSKEFEVFAESRQLWLKIHAAGGDSGLTIFFRDITEAHRAREQIEHQAYHDALTGLPNRSLLRLKLLEAVASNDEDWALMLLDLDDFKSINDAFGHPTGDRLLVEITKGLRKVVGEGGFIARLGGDEFALLLPRSADPEDTAEKLVQSLEQPIEVDHRVFRTGVSIGLAFAPLDAAEPDDLFAKADIALYEAKAAGGKTVRRFEPALQRVILGREAMKRDLATALENNELSVAYQPQYVLSTGEIIGFEALLRWDHPVRGSVSPVDFIPLAEEGGLIHAIGDWVLEQACRAAADWPDHITIAVNLSPVQFRSETLPLRILKALFVSDIRPHRLKLEVTESVLLHNSQQNMEILQEMRQLGAKIALDDFGTGYSSLSYLRHFQFDEIKIDRTFTQDIGDSEQFEAIIRAVADLGRALKVTTTAEGIETAAQQQWLVEAGFDYGQGFLFGRPMSIGQATALIAAQAEPAPALPTQRRA